MKKFFSTTMVLTLLMALCCFGILSCSKDKDDDSWGSSALVGTRWTFTFNYKTKYILEFTSDYEALLYEADVNNNYVDRLQKGMYKYDGKTITFNRVLNVTYREYLSVYYYYYFDTAVVNGNTMTLTTNEEKVTIDLKNNSKVEEDLGEKHFSLMKI